MPKGIVKWFNNSKGYGFLLSEGDHKDVFVHYSSILGEGFKTLFRGQSVEFQLCDGARGLFAQSVQLIADDPVTDAMRVYLEENMPTELSEV